MFSVINEVKFSGQRGDQLLQRQSEAQEQADQQRKAHTLSHKADTAAAAQEQPADRPEKMPSENLTWILDIFQESSPASKPQIRCYLKIFCMTFSCPRLHAGKQVETHSENRIKKTPRLGQIKVTTLNACELTDDKAERTGQKLVVLM